MHTGISGQVEWFTQWKIFFIPGEKVQSMFKLVNIP